MSDLTERLVALRDHRATRLLAVPPQGANWELSRDDRDTLAEAANRIEELEASLRQQERFKYAANERANRAEAERDRYQEVMEWILIDAAFKAPEQMGDPAIFTRWFDRLRAALNPEEDE